MLMSQFQVTTQLSPLICRKLERKLQYVPASKCTQSRRFLLWVYELLSQVSGLDGDQRDLVFDEALPMLTQYIKNIGTEQPLPIIVFADNRYVCITGTVGYIDLVTGIRSAELCIPVCVTLGYNLDVMFRRKEAEFLRKQGLPNNDQVADEPSAGQP